jgi:hypothetical protein
MPPKKDTITVRLESQIADRVERLCRVVERKLECLSTDCIKDKIHQIMKKMDRIEEDIRELQNELSDLVDREYAYTPTVSGQEEEKDDEEIEEKNC